nr:molybdenum cofactor guanylyltransferase MobA [Alsobacter ponti]
MAGGLSSRMGREKALVQLEGAPLLRHVLDRFAPQVDAIVLNANGDPARFAAFGLEVVADGRPGAPGPLAGLLAAMEAARARGLGLVATVPSDAPLLPRDLVARLAAALGPADVASLAVSPGGLEPLFALWRADAAPAIAAALDRGERAPHRLVATLPHARVAFESEAAFLNVNTPEDLRRAAELMRVARAAEA